MKRVWKAKPKFSDSLERQVLAGRGLLDEAGIKNFLDPRYEQSADPYLLTDMDKAVGRIKQALAAEEKVTVYADYDADAVTAAAVILRFFQKINFVKWDYYIPDRYSEGYGVNLQAIEYLAQRGTKLIITVDCGTNSVEAVGRAKELGVDLVITDHHQLTGRLPDAAAVVNPHRPDDGYPFKDLTGVGVAFKLVQAMIHPSPSAPLPKGEGGHRPGEGWEKWLLDLAAIGTIADCTSLLGENRTLVKWGLFVLQKTRWLGLRKLIEKAGIAGSVMDVYKVGFIIAPRLNAAGRLEHANSALELLLADDEAKARELADRLDELNRKRQKLTEQILSEAREQLLRNGDHKVLLAASENWPRGVVGLVAGKLTQEFYRPVLILEKGQEEAVGSARSVAGFNIVEAIGQSQEMLIRYGGHPMAAGFTIRSEHIEMFHQQILLYAEGNLASENLSPVLEYDCEATFDQVNEKLLIFLEKLTPFGQGNPKPRFRINSLVLNALSTVGQESKHLRLYLGSQTGKMIQCIGFNLGFWAQKLSQGQLVDVICEPEWNEWNGQRKLQLKIIDLAYSNNASPLSIDESPHVQFSRPP